MKINTTLRFKINSVRAAWLLAVLLNAFGVMLTTRAASPAELLEKGIYTEETKGELEAANQIYAQIVADQSAERSLVAQAQLRMGLCELKLGHKPRATTIFEQLTRDFPDKSKLLEAVEKNMPQLIGEIVQQIEQSYLKEVDRGELLETAIRAIVGKLDDSASYLGTNDLAQMNETVQQRIGGIGAKLKLDEETREVVIESPMPNSPAFRAGLRPGDKIISVNGNNLTPGKELDSAVKMLRGPAGESVTATIKRAGSEGVLEVPLVRESVKLPTLLGAHPRPDFSPEFMLDDSRKIGMVRLTYLGEQSSAEMQAAVESLLARGMKSLILDLRNNPGGLLAGAVQVANLFVKEGRIVTVKGRDGEQAYDANVEGTYVAFPLVVLVNRKTASAAEIIAGCLQDHHRAIVVGERTFGQGLVRSLFQLQGGLGALKLPVAAYYRPNGKNVHRYADSQDSDDWGIQPDPGFEVPMTEAELKQYEQYRAQRDNLNSPNGNHTEFVDRPLQRAVQYLR